MPGLLTAGGDKDDDDEVRLKADTAGFWAVAATSFGVILLAELGDLSDIVIANLAARYHDSPPPSRQPGRSEGASPERIMVLIPSPASFDQYE